MNAETKVVKALIEGSLALWRGKGESFYEQSPHSAQENLVRALKESWIGTSIILPGRYSRDLFQLALDRVDWVKLADYLLEDVGSTAIEDWPEFTWGTVVKAGKNLKIGDKITVFNNRVAVYNSDVFAEVWINYFYMDECKGARVKEINNE